MLKHFNETVFRGPDMEGGSDAPALENDTGDVGAIGGDVGGSDDLPNDGDQADPQKPLSVREQIKKSIAETSEPPVKTKNERGKRFGDRKPVEQEAAPAQTPEPAKPTIPAPESLSKEAKAEWEKAPRPLQEAFVKREQDMQKGVDELKQKYNLIDHALADHTDALRQMNATPGEAVNRMFLWFKALANNPVQSMPALVQSMGMDWGKLVNAIQGGQQQQQQQQASGQQQGAPEIPEPLRNYVGGLENQVRELSTMVRQVQSGFGNIQNDLTAQNEAKTRENLTLWSKGKDYFEEVRQDMARLIQADPALVKNGQVDLDTAYERAIYYNPDVRAKVLAAQQQANQQVQQQTTQAATTARQGQVAKARKASVSLPSGTPGTQGAPAKKPQQGKMSVRDSLKAAMAELTDQ